MSKYTTEVRFICESVTGRQDSVGFNDVDTIIGEAIPLIFNFDFPIFDENYREVLCTKILRHYYTREIGLESYGLWKLKLETKLNEIMPYYNKLYNSELLKFNPLYDVDMTTLNTGSKTGENTNIDSNETNTTNDRQTTRNETAHDSDTRTNLTQGTSTENNETVNSANKVDRDLYSDTPQGALTGVENENYLTNARKVMGEAEDSSVGNRSGNVNSIESTTGENSRINEIGETGSGSETRKGYSQNIGRTKNTEDYVMKVMGKSGGNSYSKLLKEFRDNFLNIDMDIIKDLGELFMLIW